MPKVGNDADDGDVSDGLYEDTQLEYSLILM
jgi:hypothetical protein